ncbi:DUF3048 domain-containing protein [Clostridium sp. DL1XJH146]
MKKRVILLTILVFVLITSGCSSKSSKNSEETSNDSNIKSSSETTSTIDTSDSEKGSEIKYFAPFTGEEVTKEESEKPAYFVSVENSPAARPQAGLNSADIVYEFMTEGGITRFLALFQKDSAKKIGPIRSMRTYFIDIAYEYNLPFAHCGGSHDALDRIKNEGSMTMDEMANGSYYFRDETIKVQEHSLFSTSTDLINLLNAKNYVKETNVELKFDKTFWDQTDLKEVNSLSITFNKYYSTSYSFNNGLYYKSMNEEELLNRHDDIPVSISNIVLQNVNYSTRSGEAYLDADLVGEGTGIIISNGKAMDVTWSKADLNSQTIFKDKTGNIVPLNVGKTWWHILDQNAEVTID